MKQTNSSYKLIEFLSGRRSSAADTVVNLEFRFGAVVLIEKLVFKVAYKNIGIAVSYFGTHGHTTYLFIIIVSEWKTV